MKPPALPSQDAIWSHFQNRAPEAFAVNRGRLRFLARRLGRPGRVLDIGVGGGDFEALAAAGGHEVWAVDPDEASIAGLRDRLGLGERARVGRLPDLPFETGTFDTVVASEVLEHLGDAELAPAVAEVRRLLRPGGRFLGTVPSGEDLAASVIVCPCCGTAFHRWGHQQSFDAARVRGLLEPGFAVERLESRPFVTLEILNWKGKLGMAAKLALWRAGVHGGDECLWWSARRA